MINRIYRLLLCVFCFGFFAAPVAANVPLTPRYSISSITGSSKSEVCSAYWANQLAVASPRTGSGTVTAGGECHIQYTLTAPCCGGVPAGTQGESWHPINTIASSCGAHSIYETATDNCKCDPGFKDNETQTACVRIPVQCPIGQIDNGDGCVPVVCEAGVPREEMHSIGWGRHYQGSGGQLQMAEGGSMTPVGPINPPPANNCFGGCTYSAGSSTDWLNMDVSQNGLFRVQRKTDYTGTGANCSTPPTTPELPPAPACSGALGTVNGLETCLPAIDTPEKETKTTTAEKILPTGAKEVTTTTTTTDCKLKECKTSTTIVVTTTPGSVSTPSPGSPLPPGSTLNPDGTVWTPTGPPSTAPGTGGVGTGPGGGQPGVTTEPLDGFCTRNPKSKLCGNEGDGDSSFGGTCSSGHECQGDAVQCAIARAAWKQACANEKGDMPEAVDVVNTDVPLSGIAKNTGWGPETASCPAPRTIDFSFGSVLMPFDLLCQFANGIRPFVIGLAWITAAFSFFGFARRGE